MRWAVYTWGTGGPDDRKTTAFSVAAAGQGVRGTIEQEPILFKVFGAADHIVQKQRADEYRDYLNMQEEAKEEAVKNITLVTAVAKRLSKP